MTTDAPSVWLTTLGCAKNQVDSDKISGQLAEAGYREASALDEADVVMVNTCAFIEAARQESIETVLEAAGRKRSDAKVMVVGCMAQRYETELVESLPEVDDVVGLDRYGELVGRLDALTNWEPIRLGSLPMDILYEVRRPAPTTPYAYVKIAEGCDKACAFCAIPQVRGAQRSRPPVNIRTEVADLVGQGVGEVVLVAQDLAAYGRDIDAPGGIVDLLQFLSDVEGLRRMRLLYLYPREISDRLIAEMAENPLVVPYFDLSLQHASSGLLRAMKRPGSADSHLDLIGRIRAATSESAMRSRLRRLQAIQDEITTDRNAEQIGKRLEVVVDTVEDGSSVARSYREAPEIDGVILLDRGAVGDWLEVEVTGAYGQELSAEVIG
jgi:ribosomal protein S12 methylthiotransferase